MDAAARSACGRYVCGRLDGHCSSGDRCHRHQRSPACRTEHRVSECCDAAPRSVRRGLWLRAELRLVRCAGWSRSRLGRRRIPPGALGKRSGAGGHSRSDPRHYRRALRPQHLLGELLRRAAVVRAPTLLLQLLEPLSARASAAAAPLSPATTGLPATTAAAAATAAFEWTSSRRRQAASRRRQATGRKTSQWWETPGRQTTTGRQTTAGQWQPAPAAQHAARSSAIVRSMTVSVVARGYG